MTGEVVRRAKPVCELTVDVSRFFEADFDVPAVRRRLFAFVNSGAANIRCGLQREDERRTPCGYARECRLPNQMNGRLLRLFSNSTESSRRLQKSSVGREDLRIALCEVRLNSRHDVQILAQHALQRTGPSGGTEGHRIPMRQEHAKDVGVPLASCRCFSSGSPPAS